VLAGLQGLTVRGRCFLAAGVTCALCGLALRERDPVRVGVLLAALPLVAVALVTRTRYRLACARRLEPARVAVGRTATVVLRLDNVSRLASGVLRLQDSLPPALGSAPRFLLDQVEPRGVREAGYPVTPAQRGRYAVGPLTVWLTDPFGLCELPRSFATVDGLVVTPRVWSLPPVRLGGEWTGGGEASARSMASAGEDDAATREYRQGDDLRKVHWRSTAHRGEMMVRREERPWQSRAAVLLDTRARAHRGVGVDSSFEWAVSAAASIGLHLAGGGYHLRLVEDTGDGLPASAPAVTATTLLDRLAGLQPSNGQSLRLAAAQLRRSGEGLVVAVLGALDPADAQALARLRHGAAACVAVLLDPLDWAAGGRRRGGGRGDGRGDGGDSDEAAARLLAAAGWRVLRAGRGSELAGLWPQAAPAMVSAQPAPAVARGRS